MDSIDSENLSWPATTSGVIAMINLQSQIESDQRQSAGSVTQQIASIERLLLRGTFRGRIADTEKAGVLAERLVEDFRKNGHAYLSRARTRCYFHLFATALEDLDRAQEHGMDKQVLDDERAGVFQAIGRYDEALFIRQEAARCSSTFQTTAALAVLHAERRDLDLAERFFEHSKAQYRGVSPFPLAMLDFQRGHLWHAEDQLTRARTWYLEALKRLPEFAAAQAHLAEVDAALGDVEIAIARLRIVVNVSDDPEFTAQLAWLLKSSGRTEESCSLLAESAARYDELTRKHPEAFADHAAEFWITNESGTERAVRYAKANFAIRQTPRALNLLKRAQEKARQDRGGGTPNGKNPSRVQ
ncbi:MAG TPA: hypothetical protein VIY49_13730 [Bryobacteraceae bacterium]